MNVRPDVLLAAEIASIADDAGLPDVALMVRRGLAVEALLRKGMAPDLAEEVADRAIELLRSRRSEVEEQRKERPPC